MSDTGLFFGVVLFLIFLAFIVLYFATKNQPTQPIEKPKSAYPPQRMQTIQKTTSPEAVNKNFSRYQIPTGNSGTLNSDDDSVDYRSINVHGNSVNNMPIYTVKENPGKLKWAGNNETLNVQGFLISHPLTYWSEGYNPEASCIDKSLLVENYKDKTLPALPYWPQYSSIIPTQRWKYLEWLSRGRTTDLDEIGYAFIFFYGLERRALIEKMDYEEILSEVQRLLSRYPVSGSFTSYLHQFTAYVIGSRITGVNETVIKKYFPKFDNLSEVTTKVVLSWHWSNNKSIPWDLCYSISKNSSAFPRTNLTHKTPELLKPLFKRKFLEHFPEGIPYSSHYDQFQMNYRPASPSLLQHIGYPRGIDRIEPLMLALPVQTTLHYETLIKIWNDCIDELKPVVSRLSRSNGEMTREIFSILPESLKREIVHPDQKSWEALISTTQKSGGEILLPISDIAHVLGIEKRDALTASQSKIITTTVNDLGYYIVPDQTISGASYKWNDSVVVIHRDNQDAVPSKNFQFAALIYEIGYGISASDNDVSMEEMAYLNKFISEKFSLNSFEIQCLSGLKIVLEHQAPSLSRIGKRLSKHLSPEQKLVFARFVGEMVTLDNKVMKGEVKALKTIFKSLEIDPVISTELIDTIIIGHPPEDPVTVLKSDAARKGEVIPPREIAPEFTLDKEKLKQTLSDTRDVQDLLSSVFEQEDEPENDIEPEIITPKPPTNEITESQQTNLPFPPETIPALDPKYFMILHELINSKEVSQEEFTILAKKYNLMPRAAFDDINSWADEELGDFLLEECETGIIINYRAE